jgi:hypothetical protein
LPYGARCKPGVPVCVCGGDAESAALAVTLWCRRRRRVSGQAPEEGRDGAQGWRRAGHVRVLRALRRVCVVWLSSAREALLSTRRHAALPPSPLLSVCADNRRLDEWIPHDRVVRQVVVPTPTAAEADAVMVRAGSCVWRCGPRKQSCQRLCVAGVIVCRTTGVVRVCVCACARASVVCASLCVSVSLSVSLRGSVRARVCLCLCLSLYATVFVSPQPPATVCAQSCVRTVTILVCLCLRFSRPWPPGRATGD